MLATTGAEAVENAIKIARACTGRSGVIAFSGAFHGRTLMGMALTGKVMPYKKSFGPFPSEILHAPFPDAFAGISVDDALAGLDRLFAADIDPRRVAAIIVEPVQGEGGFNVGPPEFLQRLRRVCDEHGIVLILDEVQTSMARTGRMFACEHSAIAPDLVTMAKGLAGGFLLSAITGKARLMNAAHAGGLGGTYAINPLSVAAAHAVLDLIESDNLCARVAASRIVEEAQARGLIVLSCGARANVIRLLPPLTIGWEILEEGLGKLQAAIEASLSAFTSGAVSTIRHLRAEVSGSLDNAGGLLQGETIHVSKHATLH